MERLRAGDWVEVRSKAEILKSLDKSGRLHELPFMPQMFQYCGQRFKVFKRAHKTCDPANSTDGRLLVDGVHLDLRCDGKAYGGCQAACLLFWKETWLKPLSDEGSLTEFLARRNSHESGRPVDKTSCTEEDVSNATRIQDPHAVDEPRYACQATQLPYFTAPLRWWDIRQYIEDYTSGNVTLGSIVNGFIYLSYWHLSLAKRGRLGRPARWLYKVLRGGLPFPRETGPIPGGQPTPTSTLDLQPGELVRVKSHKEILKTLNRHGRN